MEIYCLKCKKKTNTKDLAQMGRKVIGKCDDCGCNKCQFVGGAFDIHKLIGKLPRPSKGFVVPGKKYCGPYNPLEKQVRFDEEGNILEVLDPPADEADAVCMQHDIDYTIAKGNHSKKLEADRRMINTLTGLKKAGKTSFIDNRIKDAMVTKHFLGLGMKHVSKHTL